LTLTLTLTLTLILTLTVGGGGWYLRREGLGSGSGSGSGSRLGSSLLSNNYLWFERSNKIKERCKSCDGESKERRPHLPLDPDLDPDPDPDTESLRFLFAESRGFTGFGLPGYPTTTLGPAAWRASPTRAEAGWLKSTLLTLLLIHALPMLARHYHRAHIEGQGRPGGAG
jgi:hypothetical protein